MIDHFGFAAPVYDRLLGVPDAARLRRLLGADGLLLDLGGGTGRVSARLDPPAVVCDLSVPMAVRARRKGLRAAVARAEALPFLDHAFRRALVVDSLHHFADRTAVLTELARVLHPNGRLLVEEPDLRRPLVRAAALGERLLGMGSRFHPPRAMLEMLEAAGFRARVAETDRFRVWIVAEPGCRKAEAYRG
jgi:SAM-dependent methyltransferase